MTRRDCGKGLLGLACGPGTGGAQDGTIPPQGIGKRFRHLSYSDLGGRPDSVQVMRNRGHLYVGHMFSNGVTILDAADPRNVKPVGFFTGGDYTRTHHLKVSDAASYPAAISGPACAAYRAGAGSLRIDNSHPLIARRLQ